MSYPPPPDQPPPPGPAPATPPGPAPAAPPEPAGAAPPAAAPAAQYTADGRWYWDGSQWRQVLAPPPAPGPAWARPYGSPDTRATAAIPLVGLAVGGALLLIAGQAIGLAVTLLSFNDSALAFVGGATSIVALFALYAGLVGAAIAVPMWMHRAFRNLPALGAVRAGWSPAWAAAGWFIPFANFVVPCLVMAELWRRTHVDGDARGGIVVLWWTAWIATYLLQLVANVVAQLNTSAALVLGILSSLVVLPAGVLLVSIIRQVTRLQRARYAQLAGA